ncbi:sarcosine oxidase subunit alpha [Thalassobaculum fulvum]|uniref:Sarcosine oxidase subunit alpha n=1 Tax=Thalassobaculum fulvum TaxID=1633335 RepID=A0A918XRU6_9PROT|nr:sarcosine oxidase subunit alpha family protein [Thalassobaculum fulvum]GHD48758.1 sarcosine oxidase subunit alpha [Thalassobaculum fulvum]
MTGSDQSHRLPTGGAIDRRRPLAFRFDGREYRGYAGDTLASALLANGVRVVGRSFKYHRPRGVLTAGPEEPNALVELRGGARIEPNTRATMVELFHGLEATSQNRWPSLRFDALEVNDLLSRFLVAGFYYKTFMGFPGWHFWEQRIRAAAGMGRGTTEPDPDGYETMNAHCDVLVVGGGPAGLAAALAAGRTGARVMLLEETDGLGGRLRSDRETLNGTPAMRWAEAAAFELVDLPEVTVLTRTTGFGIYDGNVVGAVERVADHLPVPPAHMVRQRLWHIRPRRVIVAAGAIERPLVFGGNDRPGVMQAGAVRTYLNRYAVAPGRQAVVVANNDDGYRTALDLAAAGIHVAQVVDTRSAGRGEWWRRAVDAGLDVVDRAAVTNAYGRMGLVGCDVTRLDGNGGTAGNGRFVPCDLIASSGGWTPSIHLHSHAGGKAEWDDAIAAFVPGPGRAGVTTIGAAAGRFALSDCLADGFRVGAEAARDCGFGSGTAPDAPVADEASVAPLQAIWSVPGTPGRKVKRFVDHQDDVTVEDIELAHREGFVSVEHLKRYTTLGMGTDQGKTSNTAGHALMAGLRGRPIPAVGTTTFRPPYTPVAMGAFAGRAAGRHLAPIRRTALHDWHAANGVVFVEAGPWLRPQYYLRPGETNSREAMDRAITEEVVATRTRVGISDVSSLGKIDVQGPDAAEFLNRVYCNGFARLPVGKARYGLMLREDGLVDDDGTTSRLADTHFLMTTTTVHAAEVLADLEWYLQVVWPELDVRVSSVTEQWAGMALAGPRARDVLAAALDPGTADVSNEALPFLGVTTTATVRGVPVRIFRISFSGELGYEVNAPADWGIDVWEALMHAGEPHGIRPYGLEAMGIMRIEKGHVAGAELDGRTTPDDLGLGRMASTAKWYVGRGMLGKPAYTDPDRPKLVGLVPVDGRTRIRAGAILVADPDAPTPIPKLGHVTSSAYLSPTVGHPISLALLARGRERIGEEVWAVFPTRSQRIRARVTEPCFVDPEGEKLHG